MSSLSCCDLFESILKPKEMRAISTCMYQKLVARKPLLDKSDHHVFCYDILKHVSRSFAAVVIQLDENLRDAICCFYLVLRALDTIEDDMSLSVEDKSPQLLAFHEKLLLKEYSVDGIGHGYERILLQEYTNVIRMYRDLAPGFQTVIKDICEKMGAGMVEFVEGRTVETVQDYDDYCFYVAGLVGYGLTDMFIVENCDPHCGRDHQKSMGLFLQKVNICRDFLEDQTDADGPRCWWPKEIWGKWADSLEDFLDVANREKAVKCLNDMVIHSLGHLEHVVQYLSGLTDEKIFTFSAIPQVMALATLAEVYNNTKVFDGKVKIRKGVAARILVEATNIKDTKALLIEHLQALQDKVDAEEGDLDARRKLTALLTNVMEKCQ